MPESKPSGLDLLGVKPVAEAINRVVSGSVDGAAAFLSRICLPAAEEFGLLLKDRVHVWRASNLAVIVARAERKVDEENDALDVQAHPRLVGAILENGSWVQDSVVQDMWGGLLSSSCTESGDDDSNLIFVNLLSDLTKLQARLLKSACEKAVKVVSVDGLVQAERIWFPLDVLIGLTGETDIQRFDRELDHLRALELIQGGFDFNDSTRAEVTPTGLALHMYVRCEGSKRSPLDYFGLQVPTHPIDAPTQPENSPPE